jgi:hypothetical protein
MNLISETSFCIDSSLTESAMLLYRTAAGLQQKMYMALFTAPFVFCLL